MPRAANASASSLALPFFPGSRGLFQSRSVGSLREKQERALARRGMDQGAGNGPAPRDEADVLGDDLHWLTREDCSQQNDSRHASCLRAWAAFPIYSDVHYRGLHQGQAMQRFCFVVLVTLAGSLSAQATRPDPSRIERASCPCAWRVARTAPSTSATGCGSTTCRG